MRSTLIVVTCGLALSAIGCFSPMVGPTSVRRDRAAYSSGLSDSWKEQMLLNIIKLRYVDAPTFVDIGSIVVSYTLSQGATAGGTIASGSGNNSAMLGINGTFSNSPTITYNPLTGSKFILGLLTPLPPAAVFGAIQNGSAADVIMLSSLFSINGLKNQQATLDGIQAADPDFDKVRALIRKVQLSGAVRMYVKQNAQGQVTILSVPTGNIPSEIEADLKELRHLLHLNPDASEFTLVSAPIPSSDTEIAVLTRSIISLMQNLAADVDVPAEDLAKKLAFPGFEKVRDVPGAGRLISIRSAKQRPAGAFVTVNYRDSWFWIDDGDLHSKQVFLQLMTLFSMADTAPRENQPVVTIPSR